MKKKATLCWGIGLSLALGLGIVGSSGVLPGQFAWAADTGAQTVKYGNLTQVAPSKSIPVSYLTGFSTATVRCGVSNGTYAISVMKTSGLEMLLKYNGEVVEAIPAADTDAFTIFSGNLANECQIKFGKTYKDTGSYTLEIPAGFFRISSVSLDAGGMTENGSADAEDPTLQELKVNNAVTFSWTVDATLEYSSSPSDPGTYTATGGQMWQVATSPVASLDEITLTSSNCDNLQAGDYTQSPVLYEYSYANVTDEETGGTSKKATTEKVGTYDVTVKGNKVTLKLQTPYELKLSDNDHQARRYYIYIPKNLCKGTVLGKQINAPQTSSYYGFYEYSLFATDALEITPDINNPVNAEDLGSIAFRYSTLGSDMALQSAYSYVRVYMAREDGTMSTTNVLTYNGTAANSPAAPKVTNGEYKAYLGAKSTSKNSILNRTDVLQSGKYFLQIPAGVVKDSKGTKNTKTEIPFYIVGQDASVPTYTYPVNGDAINTADFKKVEVIFPSHLVMELASGYMRIYRDGVLLRQVAADTEGWSKSGNSSFTFDLGEGYTEPGKYTIEITPGMFRETNFNKYPSAAISIEGEIVAPVPFDVVPAQGTTQAQIDKYTLTYPEGYTIRLNSPATGNKWLYKGSAAYVTWNDLGDGNSFSSQSTQFKLATSGNTVTITPTAVMKPSGSSPLIYVSIPYNAWTIIDRDGNETPMSPTYLRNELGSVTIVSANPAAESTVNWRTFNKFALTFNESIDSIKPSSTDGSIPTFQMIKIKTNDITNTSTWSNSQVNFEAYINAENDNVVDFNLEEGVNPLKFESGLYRVNILANRIAHFNSGTTFNATNCNLLTYLYYFMEAPELTPLTCALDGQTMESVPAMITLEAEDAISYYGDIRPTVKIVHNGTTYTPNIKLSGKKMILTVDTSAEDYDAEAWAADGDYTITVSPQTLLIGQNGTNGVLDESATTWAERHVADTFKFTVAPLSYDNFQTIPAAGTISLDEYPFGIQEISAIFPADLQPTLNKDCTGKIILSKRGSPDAESYDRSSIERQGKTTFILNLTKAITEGGTYEVTFPAGFWLLGARQEESPVYTITYKMPKRNNVAVASWSIDRGAVLDAFEGVTVKFEGLNAIESVEQTGMIALEIVNPLAGGDDAAMSIPTPLVASLNAAKDGIVLSVDGLDKLEIAGNYQINIVENSLKIVTAEGTAYTADASQIFSVLPAVDYTVAPDPADALAEMKPVTVTFPGASVELVEGATARFEIGSIILETVPSVDGNKVTFPVPALAPSEGLFRLVVPTGTLIVTPQEKAPQYIPEIQAAYAVSTVAPEMTVMPEQGQVNRELYPQGIDVVNIEFEAGIDAAFNAQAGNVIINKYGKEIASYAAGNVIYKVGSEFCIMLPEALSEAGLYEIVIPAGTFLFNKISPSPVYKLVYNILPLTTVDILTVDPEQDAFVTSFEGVKATFIGLENITKVETLGTITYQYSNPLDPMGGTTLGIGMEATLQADGKTILFAPGKDDIQYLQSQGRWPITQPGLYTFIAEQGAVKFTNANGTVYNSAIEYNFTLAQESKGTFSPADGSTVNAISTIELTFTGANTVEATGNGVATLGTQNLLVKSISGNKVTFEAPVQVTTAGTYTVTVPAQMFAVDGSYNTELTATYTVKAAGAVIIKSVTPADGSIINDFGAVSLIFNAEPSVNPACTTPAQLFIDGALDKEVYNSSTACQFAAENDDPNICTLAFYYKKITTPGTYRVVIPAGYLIVNGTPTPALEYTYTIEAPLAYKADPRANSVVNEVKEINITFTNASAIELTDKADAYLIGWEIQSEELTGYPRFNMSVNGNVLTLSLEQGYTAPDNYDVVIAAGSVKATVDGYAKYNPEIDLKYYIAKMQAPELTPAPGAVLSLDTDLTLTLPGETTFSMFYPWPTGCLRLYPVDEDGNRLADASIAQWKYDFAAEGSAKGKKSITLVPAGGNLADLTPGYYEIVINKSTYAIEDGDTRIVNDAPFSYYYHLITEDELFTMVPEYENNHVFAGIKQFALTFPNATEVAVDYNAGTPSVAAAGSTVNSAIIAAPAQGEVAIDVTVDPEIVDKGTYTFTIPAGYVVVNGKAAPAYELVYLCDGTKGINDIFGDVESYDIYTVGGVCIIRGGNAEDVENLDNGIYIINGKKVMIRK